MLKRKKYKLRMYRYGNTGSDIMFMYAESICDLRQIADAFVDKSTLYKNYNILCEQDDKQINIDTEMFLL